MKKITFFLTSAILTSITFSARADTYNYRPYIGIDYVYDQISARGFSPHHSVGGLHFGSTYSSYFATELFYNASDSDKHNKQNTKIKTSYQSYGLDLLAMLPLDCKKRFSLLVTTGIGEYVVRQKPAFQKHQTEHGWGYRFGGGMQYAWSSAWQTRLLTRYVNFDRLSGYDHAVEYNLSLEYHF
jgi:opacity protein-like surface antigen